MDGTVLVADDDRTIRTVLTQALTRAGCRVHATSSLKTLLRWVEEGKGDLVISDVVMPDGNGLKSLPEIARMRPGLPVIIISAQNTIMTAVEAAEADAFDYLPKPFDLPDLMKRAARSLDQGRPRRVSQASRDTQTPPPADIRTRSGDDLPLVGRSARMQDVYRLIARIMNTDLSMLITGESGSGKSLIARSTHALSDRSDQAICVINPNDFEDSDRAAELMAHARGGTLLIEDVCDCSPRAQSNAVHLIDNMEEKPRLMSTSRVPLDEPLRSGKIRDDFYYRISGVTLVLPPLRQRVDDIALLAEHFLARFCRDGAVAKRLSDSATEVVRAYPWPGNVRQLRNALERLSATASSQEISREDVLALLPKAPSGSGTAQGAHSNERLADSVRRHLGRYFDLHGNDLPPQGLYQRILREIELPLITLCLDATDGNQAKAAELLGINRNTLRKKVLELDIRVTRGRKLM